MQQTARIQDLTNTAAETLQHAFVECRQPTTEGFILAALALVAEIQDELRNIRVPEQHRETCHSC